MDVLYSSDDDDNMEASKEECPLCNGKTAADRGFLDGLEKKKKSRLCTKCGPFFTWADQVVAVQTKPTAPPSSSPCTLSPCPVPGVNNLLTAAGCEK